jgi:D-beta-D-heptose 7-phosphate kinase/D-beta-D-heptose 1-phosphate adenosyltransferase
MPAADSALPLLDLARADALIAQFSSVAAVIVGDLMLDEFVFGRVSRISPEAPVPVVEFDRDEFRVGGAGNVARNVQALGGSVAVIGLIGSDDSGRRVLDALRTAGVLAGGIVTDASRPTTRKLRIVTSRNQQVARVDYERDAEPAAEIEHALVTALEAAAPRADVIVVSDYLKGVVTRRLAGRAIGIARDRGLPVLVDPKVPHLDYYTGATVVTPNNAEAETASHSRIRTHADARTAARTIRDRVHCRSVLMTRGEAGMWLLDDAAEGYLPAATREVADVTGAGDTVIATLALALAAGATIAEAASLANAAAGIAVGKFGPASVTPDELREAMRGD